MIGASTPTHEFELPFGKETVKRLLITYAQDGLVVLEKTENDVSWDWCIASYQLTQEETLLFDEKKSVEIQLRVLTVDDVALPPSKIFKVPCGKVLNREVLA